MHHGQEGLLLTKVTFKITFKITSNLFKMIIKEQINCMNVNIGHFD